MKKLLLSLFALLFTLISFGQDSLNMKKMALLSGMGAEYTDIWGYRHGSKEFAVIGSNTAINIVDVTECGNPILVHQWVDGSNTSWRDFKDYGDYIYAVCDVACNEGLQVINKNDFSHSQSTAQFTRSHNIFVEKESGRLYTCDTNNNNGGIYVYDIATDPSSPALLKVINWAALQSGSGSDYYTHDIFVKNDTAYVSNGWNGQRIWDMTDLNNLTLISEFGDATGGYNHSSWAHPTEPYLYVAEEVPIGKPIYVYDISEIADPFLVLEFKDPLESPDYDNNRPHNPFVQRDRLYISYYHDGVQVYDLSNPEIPTRIAYYDTYLDNNGNGYSGYDGNWGVYPFLPSGCILASDIKYGLYTLELTLAPDTDNTMPSHDIIIDNAAKGMVFRKADNDEFVRVTLDNQGKFVYSTITSPPTNKMEFRNSNLKFTSDANGVILKNPAGDYYRIGVNDAGDINLAQMLSLPSNAIKLSNEDLFFSHIRGGVKMKSPGNFCYSFTVTDNGIDEIESIDCD